MSNRTLIIDSDNASAQGDDRPGTVGNQDGQISVAPTYHGVQRDLPPDTTRAAMV